MDWLRLLNPISPRHLIANGSAGAAVAAAPWLEQVLAKLAWQRGETACALTLLAPTTQALQAAQTEGPPLAEAALQRWLLRHLTLDDAASLGTLHMLDGQLLRRDDAGPQWRDAQGLAVRPLGRPQRRAGVTVQAVDRVLAPAPSTLWERLNAEPGLQRFAAALAHTGMDVWLRCNGPFTVLAPSDTAMDRAAARLGLGTASLWADRDRLGQLLSHHLLPGLWPSRALPWGDSLRTLSGGALHLSTLGLLASGDLRLPLAPLSDLSCRNGVLHRVGEALLPCAG